MTGHSRPWARCVAAGAAAALAALSLSGCTGSAAPAGAPFSGGGIAFTYERGWNAGQFERRSPFISSITYLSNQPFDFVCTKSTPSRGITEVGCSPPIAALHPGGLVVQWWKSSSLGGSLATFPGNPTSIAGRPARLSVAAANADCVAGTTRSVQAAIGSVPSTDGRVLVMTACLTRAAQIREVMAMLRSLRIDG